jgi:hypothetical protein
MELSSILIGFFVLALVASVIAYTILTYVRPSEVQSLTPKSGGLQQGLQVSTARQVRDVFFTPSGATFSVYLYTMIPRTPNMKVVLFRFGMAIGIVCEAGGLSIGPSTKLYVLTQQPQAKYEIIELPSLPESKWVHLALVREGRRFTVYYNGKLVASERTQYIPVIATPDLILGGPGTQGTFVFPKLVPVPYRLEDVRNELQETSDSRHTPSIPTDWSSLNLFKGCPDGLLCFSTDSPPKENPMKFWSTPYA